MIFLDTFRIIDKYYSLNLNILEEIPIDKCSEFENI